MRGIKSFFNGLWQKLMNPSVAVIVLAYIFSVLFISAALVMLTLDYTGTALEYIAYLFFALSALGLSYSVYLSVRFAPKIKTAFLAVALKSSFARRYVEQYGFRSFVLANVSFILNFSYAVFHAVIAILTRSVWYGSLGAYYIILTVMRGGLVSLNKKGERGVFSDAVSREKEALRKFGITAVLLMVLPLCLSASIAEMVLNDRGYSYPGLIIYAAAAYTFWKITMAIINAVKSRKTGTPELIAVRNIGLADALVSVLGLQTAMFFSFGSPGDGTKLANALTGAGVCLVTFLIGLFMLISRGKFRSSEKREHGENS